MKIAFFGGRVRKKEMRYENNLKGGKYFITSS